MVNIVFRFKIVQIQVVNKMAASLCVCVCVCVCKGGLKGSSADQDTCDQMRVIFPHRFSCGQILLLLMFQCLDPVDQKCHQQ